MSTSRRAHAGRRHSSRRTSRPCRHGAHRLLALAGRGVRDAGGLLLAGALVAQCLVLLVVLDARSVVLLLRSHVSEHPHPGDRRRPSPSWVLPILGRGGYRPGTARAPHSRIRAHLDLGATLNVEFSLSDARAKARALATLLEHGHDATTGAVRLAYPFAVLVRTSRPTTSTPSAAWSPASTRRPGQHHPGRGHGLSPRGRAGHPFRSACPGEATRPRLALARGHGPRGTPTSVQDRHDTRDGPPVGRSGRDLPAGVPPDGDLIRVRGSPRTTPRSRARRDAPL